MISGIEEAQLIYQGVKWSYDFANPSLIIDIGGGSTEFILADSDGVKNALSLNIGVSRIYQELELNDPLSTDDIQTIENWLETHANGALDDFKSTILVGASGTFETLYQAHHNQDYPESSDCIPMEMDELTGILTTLIESSLDERKKNPFIIPIRQLMMPITAVKIKWLINKLKVQNFYISPHSLKEGGLKDNKY